MLLPKTLSQTIDKVASQAVGKDWPLYARLMEHWEDLVGPDYAKQTAPVKIHFPAGKKVSEKWAGGQRSGATLTISLPQGLAFEFSHKTEVLRERINRFFGYPAIANLTFKTYYQADDPHPLPQPSVKTEISPADKRALETSLNSIENNELKEALLALGASVIASDKSR